MTPDTPFQITRVPAAPKGWRIISDRTRVRVGDYYCGEHSSYWREIRRLSDYTFFAKDWGTVIRREGSK